MRFNMPIVVRYGGFNVNHLFIMSKTSLLLALMSASIFLTGCVPQNVGLDKNSLNLKTVAGSSFPGLTSAQTISNSKVKLSWNAAMDASVVAYNIYDTTLMFSPKLIKTVPIPATSATILSLNSDVYYAFRVRAVDAFGGEDSNVHDLGAIPYGGVVSSSVQSATTTILTYNDGSNADLINVYCKVGTTAVTETLLASVPASSPTQTTLNNLVPGTTYTCRVALVIGGFEDNNTVTTTFIPLGQATQLVFTTQPTSSTAGVALPSQPVIAIEDVNGNILTAGPDSSTLITLTISTFSPSLGTVRGTATVTAVHGVASFSGINFQESGTKILTATKTDTSGSLNGSGPLTADSNSFVISSGAVSVTTSSIAISPAVPPSSPLVADGNSSYSVVITLKDQYSNPISGIKPQFISSISGDTLSQPTTNTGANGQVSGSISTLTADESAPFRTLSISSPSGLSSLTTLAPFLPGTPAKLGFFIQPTNSPAGLNGIANIQLAIEDVNGNVINTGTESSGSITITIASNVNGATLSGTTTVSAVNGIATFSGLGIDKTATGYKLLASAGGYSPAYSNAFNVTAGVPQKIAITGASSVVSGSCSSSITVRLQDNGNNPSNALASTPLTISGLGSAALYTSGACTGTPLGGTLTFTAGTNTKTIYLKDFAGESLTLTLTDSSHVLTTGTRVILVNPDKISLTAAMPSPPAVAGTPMSVVAGVCSPPILITPTSENNAAAPLFNITTVAVTGVAGSSATLYSDSSCTQVLTPTSVSLPVTAGGLYPIKVYLKDSVAESFNLNVSDPNGIMATTSSTQTITILPSNINFTGPNSVVAGKCSTAFNVILKDVAGNSVVATSNTTLTINGLSGTQGKFYSTSACSGAPMTSSLTVPANSSMMTVYFSDTNAEALNIHISDPAGLMANSQTIAIGISPAAFSITGPTPANSDTTVCAGPFTVRTMDGATPTPNVTAAIGALTANLNVTGYPTGFSSAGTFYSDNSCTNIITSLSFATGDSAKSFYFSGQYPGNSLSLNAVDGASVLTTGSMAWMVKAAKGWLGTLGSIVDKITGALLWFRSGVQPVSARMNAPSSVRHLHFDAGKNFLYVTDSALHRVLKYDYTNQRYVGWIGLFSNPSNASAIMTGSNQALYSSLPSSAACVATLSGQTTPGWCLGGQSAATTQTTSGAMYYPLATTDDGTYLYVVEQSSHSINRYDINSGAFTGWIGGISSTPSTAGPGGPVSCTTTSSGITPGWCKGGNTAVNASGTTGWGYGNGTSYNPGAITTDGAYLYVGTYGAVLRFNVGDGSFAGWVGVGYTTAPTSGAAGCTTLANNAITPGWCKGGTYQLAGNATIVQNGGIYYPSNLYISNGVLYVAQAVWGGNITKYDVNTGQFLGKLPNLPYNWQTNTYTNGASLGMAQDAGTGYFYFADANRVIAVDNTGLLQGWMGKVSNNGSMSSALGNTNNCSSLAVSANTPGWCLGGTAKGGMDETSFEEAYSLESDSNGNLLVGQYASATIKIFNMTTGAYGGSLAYSSVAPTAWSNDANIIAEKYGFGDGDFYNPTGIYNDGTYLYVVDSVNGRIKKISLATGELIGWIGGATTVPTGGASGCLTMNPMAMTPGWCLGAMPNPWWAINFISNPATMPGVMNQPMGLTGDGTYLYLTDQGLHRISKYNAATGAYVGWIGMVSSTPPSGGATGCTSTANGAFTPGWCVGGTSASGTGDGMLSYPSAITHVAGKLYVVDTNNHRVSSYDASTGAFNGWIGRTNAAPSSGCTTGSNGSYTVSTSGWCKGGTAQAGNSNGERGGGFYFMNGWLGYYNDQSTYANAGANNGITSDGTNIYVSNFYNYRIDKYNLAGVWLGAARARFDLLTQVWSTNPVTVSAWNEGCSYPRGIWTDGTYLYGTSYNPCGSGVAGSPAVFKMNLSTGSMVGWQGAILPGNSPTAGDTGCAGATTATPGWCTGGVALSNYKMGQFSEARYITGDSFYIYVTDVNTQRVTRIPK